VEEPASSPSVTAPAPQPEEASTPASAAKSDVEEPKAAPSPVEEPAPSPAVTAPVEPLAEEPSAAPAGNTPEP
jgi:hypothetical protein